MRVVTIHLPRVYLEAIEELVRSSYHERHARLRNDIWQITHRGFTSFEPYDISQKLDLFQEIFSTILLKKRFTLELKGNNILELKLIQALGTWIFRYDSRYSRVFLVHKDCHLCKEQCQKILDENYDEICLQRVTSIPAYEKFTESDLEFIAKVYYILENQFPPNKDNAAKKVPSCQTKTS